MEGAVKERYQCHYILTNYSIFYRTASFEDLPIPYMLQRLKTTVAIADR